MGSPICGLQALGIVLALVVAARPAEAHQVHVFAHAEGSAIRGEVYFRGGQPVREAAVKAVGGAGETLGETKTDQQGKFSLVARSRCDHRLVVDAGAGHAAEYTVPADELPATLPLPAAFKNLPGDSRTQSTPTQAVAVTAVSSSDAQPLSAQLESLNGQVIQLRRQLDAYEQKTRLRDILGGVGYILGLMGLGGYFLGARRRQNGQAPEKR